MNLEGIAFARFAGTTHAFDGYFGDDCGSVLARFTGTTHEFDGYFGDDCRSVFARFTGTTHDYDGYFGEDFHTVFARFTGPTHIFDGYFGDDFGPVFARFTGTTHAFLLRTTFFSSYVLLLVPSLIASEAAIPAPPILIRTRTAPLARKPACGTSGGLPFYIFKSLLRLYEHGRPSLFFYRARSICKKAEGFFQVQYLPLSFFLFK